MHYIEPNASDKEVSGNIDGRIYVEIIRCHSNCLITKSCLIKPPAAEAITLCPYVIFLDKDKLQQEPLWQTQPILCNGIKIKLFACL